jgi:hypothetical protein
VIEILPTPIRYWHSDDTSGHCEGLKNRGLSRKKRSGTTLKEIDGIWAVIAPV